MSGFRTQLRIEDTGRVVGGRSIYRLLEPLVYDIGAEGSGFTVRVEAGNETDFASVPRFLFPIFPPTGKYNKAAVIHDDLYRRGFSKVVSDAVFLDAMECLGVPWWQRTMMYLAVRVFGRAKRATVSS